MKLIDKAALLAEIDKRKEALETSDGRRFNSLSDQILWNAFNSIQDVIDTLEVKEVQENPKSKFKIGDTIREKNNPQHIITIARITKCNYIGNNEDGVSFYSQDDWELVEEPVSIWHDTNQQPEIYSNILVRTYDNIVESTKRYDDNLIPWEDRIKRDGITHWCYVEDLLKL